MKSLLAGQRAANLSKRSLKSDYYVQECAYEDYINPPINLNELNNLSAVRHMSAGDRLCLDVQHSAFFIYGDSITIEGVTSSGASIGPITNAWGASTGLYKATATKDTDVILLMYDDFLLNNSYFYNSYTFDAPRQILVLKEKYSATLKNHFHSGTSEAEVVNVVHPGASITLNQLHSNCQVYTTVNCESPTMRTSVRGTFVTAFSELYYTEDPCATFTVEINNPSQYLPDKIVQMTADTIFSDSTPSYKFDQSPISVGDIFAILISVAVIIGMTAAVTCFLVKRHIQKKEEAALLAHPNP